MDPIAALRTAREEATELAQRANRLAALLDDAIVAANESEARLRAEDPAGVQGARLVAQTMALAGHESEAVERRLRGTVAPDDLRKILSQTFG